MTERYFELCVALPLALLPIVYFVTRMFMSLRRPEETKCAKAGKCCGRCRHRNVFSELED